MGLQDLVKRITMYPRVSHWFSCLTHSTKYFPFHGGRNSTKTEGMLLFSANLSQQASGGALHTCCDMWLSVDFLEWCVTSRCRSHRPYQTSTCVVDWLTRNVTMALFSHTIIPSPEAEGSRLPSLCFFVKNFFWPLTQLLHVFLLT